LPSPACEQLFAGKANIYRIPTCELFCKFISAVSNLKSLSRLKAFVDYVFVNKLSSCIVVPSGLIYLPRKGVLKEVLTWLKDARKYFLNTNGSIFFLSGSISIPLTLLCGLLQDDTSDRRNHAANGLLIPSRS
jgi:sugar phosphate permease